MVQRTLFDETATIQDRFERWLQDHPEAFPAFVRIALRLKASGYTRYSADGVMHALRWNRLIEGRTGEFLVNDHFSSRIARKAMAEVPELAGFFQTRKLKAE